MLIPSQPAWRVCHVEELCRRLGLVFTPPRARGSYGTISHPRRAGILTVPTGRAIQPVYVRAMIAFALAHEVSDDPA